MTSFEFFLDELLDVERGRGIAANLWRGVFVAKDVKRVDAGCLLLKCAAEYGGDEHAPASRGEQRGKRAVDAFINAIKRMLREGHEDVLFQAAIGSDVPLRMTTILRRSNLIPGERHGGEPYPPHVVIEPDALRDLVDVSPTEVQGLPLGEAIVQRALEKFNTNRRADAKLGDGTDYLVWVTPSEEAAWCDVVAECEKIGCADGIFDYLGLGRENGEIAALIDFDATILEDGSRRIAAPTIFEGYKHLFWRQVSDRKPHGGMGLTLHLGDLRDGLTSVGGAREAVVSEIRPWDAALNGRAERFFVTVNGSSNPTADDCALHLWSGLDRETLRRDFLELTRCVFP